MVLLKTCGKIDFIEVLGQNTDRTYGAIHCDRALGNPEYADVRQRNWFGTDVRRYYAVRIF